MPVLILIEEARQTELSSLKCQKGGLGHLSVCFLDVCIYEGCLSNEKGDENAMMAVGPSIIQWTKLEKLT